MQARKFAAALCLIALLAVVGCSAEVRDYQNALGDWSETLSSSPAPEMQHDQNGKAVGYDDSEVTAYRDTLKDLLGQLQRITPPEELTAEHTRVVAAFSGVCDKEEQFWDAFFRGDTAATQAAGDAIKAQMAEFNSAWKQLTDAVDEAR
jgi:hypothetical protein